MNGLYMIVLPFFVTFLCMTVGADKGSGTTFAAADRRGLRTGPPGVSQPGAGRNTPVFELRA